MFVRRKRPPIVSDSSDDDGVQPRKLVKLQNAGNSSFNGTRKRQLNENINSRSSFTHNSQQARSVRNDEASSSSDIEQILHPVKRGSVRALSDYETGESTDIASGASSSTVTHLRRQASGPFLVLSTSSQTGEVLHSSSDNDVIQPTKRRKIQSNFVSSSDSSDDGVPIGVRRSTKHMKLPSSSEESGSDDSFENDSVTESARRNNSTVVQRNLPIRSMFGSIRRQSSNLVFDRRSTNRINLGQSRQQTRRSLRSRNNNRDTSSHIQIRFNASSRLTSSGESDSDFWSDNIAQIRGAARNSRRATTMARRSPRRSPRPGPARLTRLRSRNNRQNSINNVQRPSTRTQVVQESVDNNYSSDSDIINIALRHRRVPLIPSEDSSSSSDHRVLLRSRNNSQGNRLHSQSQSRRTGAILHSEEDSSSESALHITLRHRRHRPIIQSEDNNTSSFDSSDSAESVLIQNRIGHRTFYLSNESEDEVNSTGATRNDNNRPQVDSLNLKTSTEIKVTQDNSSDSDGESEKCPICLIRFNLQEIGTPSSCNHNFCSVCLQEWAKNKNTCPVDRQLFDSIIVRAHIQGKVTHQVPVETPPPDRTIVQSFLEMWGNVNANIVEIERSSSSEFEDGDGPDETCCVCLQSHSSESMILCDFCNNVYHMRCINPPLQYVPAMDWFCPDCVQNEMWPSESD